MSTVELRCANASPGEKEQIWTENEEFTFRLASNTSCDLLIESAKAEYRFSVRTPPQTAAVSCVLRWDGGRWHLSGDEEFYVRRASDTHMKLYCLL